MKNKKTKTGILFIALLVIGCQKWTAIVAPENHTTGKIDLTKFHERVVGFISFNDFVTQVMTAGSAEDKMALVDSFIVWAQSTTGIPYLEDTTRTYFLYRSGSVSNLSVAGDFNNWDPQNHDFTHLSGTDLFYRMETFESDARLDYKFVVNGSQWILDPLNPHTCSGGFGPNSEVAMPLYVQPPEIKTYTIPHGTIVSQSFTDSNAVSRSVKVYLPPNYATSTDSFPVAYFHDGSEWVTLGSAKNVMDYLTHYQQIQPIIGVFVDPTDRNQEYSYDQNFMNMFCNQLMPWIEAQYRISQNPAGRASIGVSLGGLTSLYFCIQRPDLFGNCGAFSPAIWFGDIMQQYQNADQIATTIYLDAGTYEPSIYNATANMRTVLDNRGTPYTYFQWHEGHSWGAWRAHLDEALKSFYPTPSTGIDEEDRH